MNREAQIATVLTVRFAAAFVGWALVHLASSPSHPRKYDQRGPPSRFRKWLDATTRRLAQMLGRAEGDFGECVHSSTRLRSIALARQST